MGAGLGAVFYAVINYIYIWMMSTSELESRDILERNNGSLLKAIQLCTQRYVILC